MVTHFSFLACERVSNHQGTFWEACFNLPLTTCLINRLYKGRSLLCLPMLAHDLGKSTCYGIPDSPSYSWNQPLWFVFPLPEIHMSFSILSLLPQLLSLRFDFTFFQTNKARLLLFQGYRRRCRTPESETEAQQVAWASVCLLWLPSTPSPWPLPCCTHRLSLHCSWGTLRDPHILEQAVNKPALFPAEKFTPLL